MIAGDVYYIYDTAGPAVSAALPFCPAMRSVPGAKEKGEPDADAGVRPRTPAYALVTPEAN